MTNQLQLIKEKEWRGVWNANHKLSRTRVFCYSAAPLPISNKTIVMQDNKSKKDLNKATKRNLTNEEVEKMVNLFNERGYSLTQLDLLDKLSEQYSAQKIVLQLLKSISDTIDNSPFINQVEKDELELQFAALTHFASLIKEAA